jgi:hypothetical protein
MSITPEDIAPEVIIGNFHNHVSAAKELSAEGYELASSIREEGRKVTFPIDEVETIEPGDEPGTFVMRLRNEIVENKGKIMIISGATLLAISGLIIQRKRSHKD